jgi:hypothetical protein
MWNCYHYTHSSTYIEISNNFSFFCTANGGKLTTFWCTSVLCGMPCLKGYSYKRYKFLHISNISWIPLWMFDFLGQKTSVNLCIWYTCTSNVNDIKTKAQTFRYQRLLSERKQYIFIWSAYYWNKSKKFWFGPKNSLSQTDHFRFGLTNLGRSKSI